MIFRMMAGLTAAASLFGCGPVPSDTFLTLSVSTDGVGVTTSVNGKANDFLSGDSGSMVTSAPLNKLVRKGANEVAFKIKPVDSASESFGFYAKLEISFKGEIIDTAAPGERVIFERELNSEEIAKLNNGETFTITEAFNVDPDALKSMKP